MVPSSADFWLCLRKFCGEADRGRLAGQWGGIQNSQEIHSPGYEVRVRDGGLRSEARSPGHQHDHGESELMRGSRGLWILETHHTYHPLNLQ